MSTWLRARSLLSWCKIATLLLAQCSLIEAGPCDLKLSCVSTLVRSSQPARVLWLLPRQRDRTIGFSDITALTPQNTLCQNVRLYDSSIRYSSRGHVVDEAFHDTFQDDWLERRRKLLRDDQALPSFAVLAGWHRLLDCFIGMTLKYEGFLSLHDFQNLTRLCTPTELISKRLGQLRHTRCANTECGNKHPACSWRVLSISDQVTGLYRKGARRNESYGKQRPARHLDNFQNGSVSPHHSHLRPSRSAPRARNKSLTD